MSGAIESGPIAERWMGRLQDCHPEFGELREQWNHEANSSALEWVGRSNIPLDAQMLALAEVLGLRVADDLTDYKPSLKFVERIPIGFARQHQLIGFDSGDESLLVAVSTPAAMARLDVVSRFLGCRVQPIVAHSENILAAINRAYEQRTGQAQAVIDTLDSGNLLAEIEALNSREDLLDVADRAPVIKLVNMLLFDAVKGDASDVHIQPYEDRLVIRLRIDGMLFNAFEIPKRLQDEVVSRIKVIGGMDIAERRLPQDGRSTVKVGSRTIDLRIASLPTCFGERVVIRLLDKSARVYTLGDLGMDAVTHGRFGELIKLEHGLILVTGPTGSGKSTTLYAGLKQIDWRNRNVVTLEDPIEYQLQGISQTQISDKKGMTFASGLRHVLRQDPDIIMVGEIRDRETAVMAIQSALTGHLVFSTLHTNDSASAVTRLLDLGIEPYLVASSVIVVLAQRLVRKVCVHCEQEVAASATDLSWLGLDGVAQSGISLKHGVGCKNCRQTGYSGRLGLFELLVVDDAVRDQVQSRANASQIRDVALSHGMRRLREDGRAKVLAGLTTIEEVERVTMRATS
jgi:general secretion pathway protein E